MKSYLESFLSECPSPGSFMAALQFFLQKRHAAGLSEYSLVHLYHSLHPLGVWLDNCALSDVTARELKVYVDELWLRYSSGTLRPVIGDIKQFFRWCKRKGLLKRNIAKRLKKPKKRATRKSRPVPELSVSAVAEVLTGLLKKVVYRDLFGNLVAEPAAAWSVQELTALRDLFILVFLYETGGRAGELASLSRSAMDRTIGEGGSIFVITVTGKTADEDLFFTRSTAELWLLWRRVRPVDDDYAIYSLHRRSWGSRLTTNGISQVFVRRSLEAGVAVFRSHALRHSKVQRVRRLAGLEVASVVIGHSNASTTLGYANITDDEVTDAVLKTGLRLNLFGRNGEKKTADE